jgi:phospholipid transport system substrate-binding protein
VEKAIEGGRSEMTRRFVLTNLAILTALATNLVPHLAFAANAADFMNELWKRAVEVLGRGVSPNVRLARFREMFETDFDVPGIARFVLGRYWRSASEREQQEFLQLFEDYVVYVYSARLADFGGEALKVRGSRAEPEGTIVSTDIIQSGGAAPIKIDWRLIADKGSFKIGDVIIEGISMAVTQRSEFASVIQRNGGQVGGLLALMREKTKTASLEQ